MIKEEQKLVLESFLKHHSIEMIPTARLPHYGRRFSAYFPSIAAKVNPTAKPWTKDRVSALAQLVVSIDPASVIREPGARAPRLERRFKNLNRTRAFLLSREWKKLRYSILLQRGAVCELCGKTGKQTEIHVDHIKPISKNWDLRLARANLQVLCSVCNLGKGNWDATDHRGLMG